MHALIESYFENDFFTTLELTKDFHHLLVNRLKFMNSQRNKEELLEDELKALEKQFKNNPYNYVLTPDNYFNELRSQPFVENLWKQHKWENGEAVKEFRANINIRRYNGDEMMEDEIVGDETGNGFAHFFDMLKKSTVIKHQLFLLNYRQDVNEVAKIENKYPSVFVDEYSYELFNYLIKKENKKIGPAYVYKYFDLFMDEDLIKRTAKPGNFLRFLKTIHLLDFNKLDKRTGYTAEHKENLVALKNSFKIKAHVN